MRSQERGLMDIKSVIELQIDRVENIYKAEPCSWSTERIWLHLVHEQAESLQRWYHPPGAAGAQS